MAFVFEWLRPGSSFGDPQHEAEVLSHFDGLRPGMRAIDPQRKAALYAKTINGDKRRPPGEYLLFLNGRAVQIEAYQWWNDAAAKHVVYQVVKVLPPELLLLDDTKDVIQQALTALAHRNPVTRVDVNFATLGGR